MPNLATPRGHQDPHQFLGQRVARTFDTVWQEGTVVAFDIENLKYAVTYEADSDTEQDLKQNDIFTLIDGYLDKSGSNRHGSAFKCAIMLFP